MRAVAAVALAVVVPLTIVGGATASPRPASDADRAAAKVTIARATTGIVVSGTYVRFTGRAPRSLAGKRVQLQQKATRRAAWVTVGRGRVKADGSWGSRGTARGANRNFWRVKLKTRSATLISSTLVHKVYSWRSVSTDFDFVEGDGGWRWAFGAFDVNGQSYEQSIGASAFYSGTRTNQVDLGRRCLTFQATVGLSDDAESATRVTAAMYADSAQVWRQTGFALGSSTPISLDVANVLRLRFDSTRTSTDGDGYLVWGNARLLCTG